MNFRIYFALVAVVVVFLVFVVAVVVVQLLQFTTVLDLAILIEKNKRTRDDETNN